LRDKQERVTDLHLHRTVCAVCTMRRNQGSRFIGKLDFGKKCTSANKKVVTSCSCIFTHPIVSRPFPCSRKRATSEFLHDTGVLDSLLHLRLTSSWPKAPIVSLHDSLKSHQKSRIVTLFIINS
jgi:hypothetical protein